MSSHIDDVRKHLFATLEGLRDKENPMDIDRARAVVSVAQTLIDSAKVEIDYLKVTGADSSTFLAAGAPALSTPAKEPAATPLGQVTRHLLRG